MSAPRKPAFCDKCGEPLAFRKRNGKLEPCNPDGSDHWDRCREIRYARAMRGEKIDTADITYFKSPTERSGRFVIRESYGQTSAQSRLPEACGACAVPPWEDCKCTRKAA